MSAYQYASVDSKPLSDSQITPIFSIRPIRRIQIDCWRMGLYAHLMPERESEAAAKMDLALRAAFGQQSGQQNAPATPASQKESAAKARGLRVIPGGRSRTRTSDLILIRDAL